MKKAFINESGVLVAWGHFDTHNDDQGVEVDDDFAMQPGRARLVNGVWQEFDPASAPPTSVTMRQARLALLAAGKLDAVQTAIAGMAGSEGQAARIEWEFAATVDRNSPFVQQLAEALGLDAAALNALFTHAASL